MGKFIYQHATPNEFRRYFGNANVYGDGEDIKLDYNSQLICLHTDVNGVAIRVRIGTVSDFSELPRLGSYIVDFAFSGKKVNAQEYGHLCAVAGAMLVAQGQNVLASAGMASNANITIPSVHNEAATLAARQILKPGTPGATLTIISKQLFQVSSEGNNPAIGNWENIEVSMYYGEAVN